MKNPIKILLHLSLILCCFSSFAILAGPSARIVGGSESAENNWKFMTALMLKPLGVTVNDQSFEAFFMARSPIKLFEGVLVNCGKAFTKCIGVDGKICLIERGETTFAEKARNCEDGNGIGAIIYNNLDERFFGSLGLSGAGIPVVSTSLGSGNALLNHLGENVAFGYTNIIPEESFCGASYIGGKWLLTAAHCVKQTDTNALLANVGGHDVTTDRNNVIGISKVVIHDNYDSNFLEDDIALLQLTKEPEGVDAVSIADDLLLNAAIITGDPVTEIGRGQQRALTPEENTPLEPSSPILNEVGVNLVTNDECNNAFSEYFNDQGTSVPDLVTKKMVCAGTPQGTVGTCFGDSGGPLVLQQEGTDYLVGITSWGLGCAYPGLYDVFTRVPAYKAAIERVTSGVSTQFQDDEEYYSSNSKKKWFAGLNLHFVVLIFAVVIIRRILKGNR